MSQNPYFQVDMETCMETYPCLHYVYLESETSGGHRHRFRRVCDGEWIARKLAERGELVGDLKTHFQRYLDKDINVRDDPNWSD